MTYDGIKHLAPASVSLEMEMVPFDEFLDDFLGAPFGDAAFKGEKRNAWPGTAFLLVDEIAKRVGGKEGERGQLSIGTHLVEPKNFLARKSFLGRHRHLGQIRMSFCDAGSRP